MNKKIVIIGGGISGLTAGIYALKAGFDVELYEKHSIVGGECTGWDRKGFHIDNSMTWLNGTREGSDLNRIWKTTGALDDSVKVFHFDRMYTSELNGERVSLWRDLERTERELLALSPADAEEIRRLIDYARMVKDVTIPADKPYEMWNLVDGLKMLPGMGGLMKLFKAFEGMDTQDYMNRFQHPLIRLLISDFCMKESLGYYFPMTYGNFVGGDGGRPQGGARAMAFRMANRFTDLGGKIFTGANAVKIEVAGEQAIAALLADGRLIGGDYFICACDTAYTFQHLLDPSYMDATWKRLYEDEQAYPVSTMFQAAFAVDSAEDVVGGDLMLTDHRVRVADWISDRMVVKSFLHEPGFAPEGKQVVQVQIGVTAAGYAYWKALRADHDAYNEKKRELADLCMRALEDRFPAFAGKLSVLDAWTPMTYERYCNAYKGANQSFMITKYGDRNVKPTPTFKRLKNVVLAGQWLIPPSGGLTGAAIQGKFAAQRVCKKDGQSIQI